MASVTKQQTREWIERIVEQIPCRTLEELRKYIATKSQGKVVYPRPEIRVGDHWFCIRRYHDVVTDEDILEVYVGSRESGDEYMGYDRIDPDWTDAEGRQAKRWELTRAYMRPRYRGRDYSVFMLELVIALARKNRARSVVAYPRHVAMLITLLRHGFRTMDGSYDETLMRIFKQGQTWYGLNPAQRRLYYAQEFRPFIQDGSFIMEKQVTRKGFWEYLFERV